MSKAQRGSAAQNRCRLRSTAALGTDKTAEMFDTRLTALAESVARKLMERHETIAVAESSCGGLISASLLSIPGASAYYVGGTVTYTRLANQAFLASASAAPSGLQGETEEFALYLAHAAAGKLDSTWAIGESGAAGPLGSRYGDPAGHVWVAVTGAVDATRHLLTGSKDRSENMVAFAAAALGLLAECLD
jgi:nicotinamide-nucleotide amidase